MLLQTSSAQTSYCINWKVAAELPTLGGAEKALGVAGPLAGVHNGVLLIGGGANFPDSLPWLGGKKRYYREVYVFDRSGSGMGFLKSCTLPVATAYGASTSTPQGVVYAGGESENGFSNRVWLVKWNAAKQDIVVKSLPPLPVAVTNASITSDGNMVYVAGGESPDSVSAQFFRLDLKAAGSGWQALPSLPHAVSHAVLVVQGKDNVKTIYLIGGRKKTKRGISELYASVYAYDVLKKQWQEKAALPYALSAGTGVAANADHILLFGGDKGETFHKTEVLIAAINAEQDEAKKTELNAQKTQTQATHPGFSHDVLQYDIYSNEWKIIDTIPFEVPVTTTAVKWGRCIFMPSGEVRAGVRTPQILEATVNPCP